VSPGRVALLLALLAAVLYGGVALPAATRLAAARAEIQELQGRRDARSAGLMARQRREDALQRAALPAESASVMGVRRGIVKTLDAASLGDATVDVRPGRAPAVATVRVAVSGDFAELVQLAQRLAEPGSGLVFDRVRLTRSQGRMGLEVLAWAVGPR